MRRLVGRRREMAELAAAAANASAGRGALVLLAGEAGIGKTRLVDELAQRALEPEMRAVRGRCWESGGAPAYWPWIQVLRAIVRPCDARTLEAITGADAAGLAELVPEIRRLLPEARALPALDPAQARFRLFDAVAGFLRRSADLSPLSLLFDDLHAADPSSLLLLTFVARELPTMRALVIGTYRDTDARQSPEIGELLGKVAREGVTLSLKRLERDEIAALVENRLGHIPGEALLDAIQSATEGNPLFVDEVARRIEARGALEAGLSPENIGVPEGVRATLRERLRHLPPETVVTLEKASVIGRDFDTATLAAVEERPARAVETQLAAAVASGLLVRLGGGRYRISHLLVREAVYEDIDAADRARAHLRVAGVIGRRSSDPPAGQRDPAAAAAAEVVAHHLLCAMPEAPVPRVVQAVKRAAEHASRMLAHEAAATLLERALTALETHAPDEASHRCELTLALADAQRGAGAITASKETCLRAASLARGMGSAELLAGAALTYGAELMPGIVDPSLVSLLEEALASIAPGDGALRARVQARLSAALQPAADPLRPTALAREAVAMARRTGDPGTLLAVLNAASSALADFGDPAERAAVNTEIVRLGSMLGDKVGVLRARARLVFDALELGDLAAADASIDAHGRLAAELGRPVYQWRTPLLRSMRAQMEGRWDEARGFIEDARRLVDKADDPSHRLCLTLHVFGLLRAAERHDELLAYLPEVTGAMDGFIWSQVVTPFLVAGAHARAEDVERARAAAQRAVAWPAKHIYPLQVILYGEAAAATNKDRAAKLYERALPLCSRYGSWGMAAMLCEAPLARILGVLATALGKEEEARAHFEAAATGAARLGMRPHVARIQYEHARALAGFGHVEDTAPARALLAAARRTAAELSMPGLLRLIDALDAKLGTAAGGSGTAAPVVMAAEAALSPGALRVPDAPAFRFRLQREGELWLVSANGTTAHLRHTRGLEMLARLIERPGEEVHVLSLDAPLSETQAGSAGPMVDPKARDAYRQRVLDLHEEEDDAEACNDRGRAAKARAEIESLSQELARAFGLGGRAREAASDVERARVNVQRRLRDAVRRIAAVSPSLGEHLDRAVYTGAFCSYRPDGRRRL